MHDPLLAPSTEFDWGPDKSPLGLPAWIRKRSTFDRPVPVRPEPGKVTTNAISMYLVLIGLGSALLTAGLVWIWA